MLLASLSMQEIHKYNENNPTSHIFNYIRLQTQTLLFFFVGTFIFQKDSLSLSSSDNICKRFRSRSGLHNTKNLIYIQTCSRKNFLMVFSLKNAAGGIMNNIRSKNLIDF